MAGHFFEDFQLGQVLRHASPRTLHGGDIALYFALTGERRALPSSTDFAQKLGLSREVCPELLAFHTVFGKSVADVSFNAVANLGYADVRFLRPVYPGDTLAAESEVIGLKQTSTGQAGVVYVRTTGRNQRGDAVMQFVRWVLVNKRASDAPGPAPVVPILPQQLTVADLPIPQFKLDRLAELRWALGGNRWFEDYRPGEVIVHHAAMTIDESDHVFATRLYQNGAQVHFDGRKMAATKFGRRLMYGGHVISVAYALAHDGFENVLAMVAWNGGTHHHPTFGGDTVVAWSEVVACEPLPQHPGLGALRVRMYAAKDVDVAQLPLPLSPEQAEPRHVLTLDYWCVVPTRAALATTGQG